MLSSLPPTYPSFDRYLPTQGKINLVPSKAISNKFAQQWIRDNEIRLDFYSKNLCFKRNSIVSMETQCCNTSLNITNIGKFKVFMFILGICSSPYYFLKILHPIYYPPPLPTHKHKFYPHPHTILSTLISAQSYIL